jgi:preprotein translocase subunit SecG
MTIIFLILVILASAILGFIVLVQNPKGGGLSGNIAGFSNQFMGVKQTTDVLEKGTWIFAGVIGVLCLFSTVFISSSGSSVENKAGKISNAPIQQSQPVNPGTLNTTPGAQPQTNPQQQQPK